MGVYDTGIKKGNQKFNYEILTPSSIYEQL